jgi:hypothetical protein
MDITSGVHVNVDVVPMPMPHVMVGGQVRYFGTWYIPFLFLSFSFPFLSFRGVLFVVTRMYMSDIAGGFPTGAESSPCDGGVGGGVGPGVCRVEGWMHGWMDGCMDGVHCLRS